MTDYIKASLSEGWLLGPHVYFYLSLNQLIFNDSTCGTFSRIFLDALFSCGLNQNGGARAGNN
jgi:hypothetical protein